MIRPIYRFLSSFAAARAAHIEQDAMQRAVFFDYDAMSADASTVAIDMERAAWWRSVATDLAILGQRPCTVELTQRYRDVRKSEVFHA